MYYVYILQSQKNGYLYIGCTSNINKRLEYHKSNKVPSTRKFLPVKLIYAEIFLNKKDAFNREKFLKTGWGRNYVKKTLHNFLQSVKILQGKTLTD